jgi:hypothetical protein
MALLRTLITGSLAVAGLGTATTTPTSAPVGEARAAVAATVPALGPDDALHVGAAADGRTLRTADGRRVVLRGANVNALVDYGGQRATVPVTDADARQTAALGFTVVRLAVSWSRIEPAPGSFDAAYLEQVRTTARRFVDAGVYVLLDMHQDRYAAGLGPSGDESDGAPLWAARTDGSSAAKDSGGHPYYGTMASRVAANNFFTNATVAGKGLQEHYADAVARVAAVGDDLGPGLAGVELYNEPVDPIATDPFAADTFTRTRLHPLYTRLISRLRGPDGTGPGGGAYDGPIWFEGQATRTWTDDDRAAERFSTDPNLVYGPHVYTDVYDGEIGEGTRARLATSFDNAAREAGVYGAALAPTELPGASGGPWEEHRAETLRNLDRLGIGGMVWVWKQHASANYGWGVLNADGTPRTDSGIARDYGRARLVASSAPVRSSAWSAGTLTVSTTGAGVVELWDGAAFGTVAPTAGVANRLTLDGASAPASAVSGWSATAPLGAAGTWAGGRRLRVTVPAGEHTLVLRPAATSDPATVDPPAAQDPVGTAPADEHSAQPVAEAPSPDAPAAAPAVAPPGTEATPVQVADPGTTAPAATSSTAATPQPAGTSHPTGTSHPAGTSDPVATAKPAKTPAPATKRASTAAPRVVETRVAPARFRPVASRGGAARGTASRGGTRVTVVLERAARLRVAIERRSAGRVRGDGCVPAERAARGAAGCTHFEPVTTRTVRVAGGRTVVPITGRVGSRVLPPGAYRVVLTPLGPDGRAGAACTTALAVLPTAG